jgi:hypothetical protein
MTKISRFSTSVVLALNRVRTPIRSKSQYLLSVSRVILRSDKVARVSRAEASAAKHRPQFRHYFIPLDGIRAGRNNKSAPYHGGGRGRGRGEGETEEKNKRAFARVSADPAGIARCRASVRAALFFFRSLPSPPHPPSFSRDINSPGISRGRTLQVASRDNAEANKQKTRLHSRIDNRMRSERTEKTYEGGEERMEEGEGERRSCVVFKCRRSAELF